MMRWILAALVVATLASLSWWLLQRSPFTGSWVNIDVPAETLRIERSGADFMVAHSGSAALLMRLEDGRLRAVEFGSTLELHYDDQSDQLRYPIFTDTVRVYRRAD